MVLRSTSSIFAFYVEKGRESNTGKIFARLLLFNYTSNLNRMYFVRLNS